MISFEGLENYKKMLRNNNGQISKVILEELEEHNNDYQKQCEIYEQWEKACESYLNSYNKELTC
jgi:hypothetical protein